MTNASSTPSFTAVQREQFAASYVTGINGMRPTVTFCPISNWCHGGNVPSPADTADAHALLEG